MKFRHRLFVFSIPFLFFLTGVLTIKDYGTSWDEPIHFYRGQALLYYFLTGKKNFDPLPVVRAHLPKFVDEDKLGKEIVEKNNEGKYQIKLK